MKLFVDKKDCCGCAACANICPKSAITMEKDEIGQYYPRINEALCVDCGTCMRVCDFQKKTRTSLDIRYCQLMVPHPKMKV